MSETPKAKPQPVVTREGKTDTEYHKALLEEGRKCGKAFALSYPGKVKSNLHSKLRDIDPPYFLDVEELVKAAFQGVQPENYSYRLPYHAKRMCMPDETHETIRDESAFLQGYCEGFMDNYTPDPDQ